MEKYLKGSRSKLSCDCILIVDCMKNNSDAFAVSEGGRPCGKYVIFLEREGGVQCDDAVNSIQEADFIIESHAGNFDACWIEKCVGGEWVTVKIAKNER
ncbi:hypothetical protein [Azospirillum sp.]|uniref:hypothetical protein n=1 Tax=Azospirillum sp. TaxID=34012 RepID=UPI002D66134F|nr:hypothetical protein [Azospirillum sp.]HYD68370.1 hypothetical protein [Azospirillum sp.]